VKITPTALEGALIVDPIVHADERGWVMESWHQRDFDAAVGQPVRFVQDNQSASRRGVLRGLHYQLPPHAQGKLIRVLQGRIYDVAVDLRRSSQSFGRWIGIELSAENRRQLWLPPGLAHGYLVLGDGAEVFYKATAHYAQGAERCISWNDPTLAIDWPLCGGAPVVSGRDARAPAYSAATCFD
jgi:dTDP-4-dehydrorhamnose 3,5-epimerase